MRTRLPAGSRQANGITTETTPYAGVPLTVATLLGLLAGRSGGLMTVAAIAAGSVLAAGLLVRPRVADVDVILHVPRRTVVGTEVTVAVELRNTRGRRASSAMSVTVSMAGWEPFCVAMPGLHPGETASAELRRTPHSRAWEDTPRVTLTSSAPLGIVRRTRLLRAPYAVAVHPVPSRVGLRSPVPATRGHEDLAGLREWRQGDSLRQVSARHSARRQQLVTIEREQVDLGPLAVVIEGGGDLEHTIALAARIALDGLREGRRVAVLSQSPVPLAVVRSPAEVLDACSRVLGPCPSPAGVTQATAWAGRSGEVVRVAGARDGATS